MECLACGDCCRRMSPLTGDGRRCPYLTEESVDALTGKSGDVICSCEHYEKRPEECVRHRFDSRFCPIGVSVLGLTEAWQVAARIDLIWKHRQR